MKNENLKAIQRVATVLALAAIATLMVWRANSYVDPGGHTVVPQLFLCLTGLLFGFTAFSVGLGYGREPEPQTE